MFRKSNLSVSWTVKLFFFPLSSPTQQKAQFGLLTEGEPQWTCSMQRNLHGTSNHFGGSWNYYISDIVLWTTMPGKCTPVRHRCTQRACGTCTHTWANTHAGFKVLSDFLRKGFSGSVDTVCTLLIKEEEDPSSIGREALLAGWSSINQHNEETK